MIIETNLLLSCSKEGVKATVGTCMYCYSDVFFRRSDSLIFARILNSAKRSMYSARQANKSGITTNANSLTCLLVVVYCNRYSTPDAFWPLCEP
jgi:hypothetical protein